MKIFIICCILFIRVNMCIYHAYVYRKSLFLLLCCHTKRVSGIHSGFGYPRVRFWGWIITRIGVRCSFRFRFRVSGSDAQRLHPTRIRPVAIPDLGVVGFGREEAEGLQNILRADWAGVGPRVIRGCGVYGGPPRGETQPLNHPLPGIISTGMQLLPSASALEGDTVQA